MEKMAGNRYQIKKDIGSLPFIYIHVNIINKTQQKILQLGNEYISVHNVITEKCRPRPGVDPRVSRLTYECSTSVVCGV